MQASNKIHYNQYYLYKQRSYKLSFHFHSLLRLRRAQQQYTKNVDTMNTVIAMRITVH